MNQEAIHVLDLDVFIGTWTFHLEGTANVTCSLEKLSETQERPHP